MILVRLSSIKIVLGGVRVFPELAVTRANVASIPVAYCKYSASGSQYRCVDFMAHIFDHWIDLVIYDEGTTCLSS